jgi:DNA-binding NtrC family response regulator
MDTLTSSSVLLVDECSSRREQIRDQLSDTVGDVALCPPSFGAIEDLPVSDRFISTMAVNISPLEMYPTTFVQSVHRRWPWISILLFDGPRSAQLAVAAMKAGASDYLPGECTASDVVEATETNLRRRAPVQSRDSVFLGAVEEGKLIGNSEPMQSVFSRFGTATETALNVLLLGEPGTGKTFTAQALHAQSTRSGAPFLLVDCRCAKPSDVRTLFLGDQLADAPGPDAAASLTLNRDLKGGTVVLDHVDELDSEAQDAVAHAMEVQDFTSRGPDRDDPDERVRFIGITSSPSPPEAFRTDLYYQLGELPISLPPLSNRSRDILPLARHFLSLHGAPDRGAEPTFTSEAQSALRNYSWPGNVRQLKNAVNRAVRATSDSNIRREDLLLPETPASENQPSGSEVRGLDTTGQGQPALPTANQTAQVPNTRGDGALAAEGPDSGSISFGGGGSTSIPSLEELKKRAVKRAYDMFDGDVDRASVALDIGRSTMYRMLKRYDLRDRED